MASFYVTLFAVSTFTNTDDLDRLHIGIARGCSKNKGHQEEAQQGCPSKQRRIPHGETTILNPIQNQLSRDRAEATEFWGNVQELKEMKLII